MTIDSHDPGRLARFWATALGYRESAPPTGFNSWQSWFAAQGVPQEEWDDGAYLSDLDGALPSISIMKVTESKSVKNRLHLDLQVGGGRSRPYLERWPVVEAEVSRLTEAGATVLVIIDDDHGRPDHYVMADPEGNEFCLL